MRNIELRRIGLALAPVVVAVSALASAGVASASLPEAGHCVKVATGTGAYRSRSCLQPESGSKGKYNFVPLGTTEKPTFSVSGTITKLKTTELSTITCTTASISGEFTGPKSTTDKAVFDGCTIERRDGAGEPACQTGATSGQLEIPLAEGELGFIKAGATVGLDLHAPAGSSDLLTFVCAPETTGREAVVVEGSVIAKLTPIDKTTQALKLLYRATGKAQIPEKFETGAKDTLTSSFTGLAGTFTGPSTLGITGGTGTYSEALEIKAR